MIATCEEWPFADSNATVAARTATARRGQSGVSVRAMANTAWATTATASLRP